MKYQPLVWHGQAMTGKDEFGYRMVWEPTPSPEGGDRVSMGSLGMMPASEYETPTHYEVPVTLWGDYCGSDVGRSNYRSLLRDYPETFIEVTGDFFSQYLAIPVDALTEDLDHIFTGLAEQYPLYDDDDHSALEFEESQEQYEQYLRADILRDLDRAGVDTDAIDTADLDARFWEWVSNGSSYPYFETATSIYFPEVEDFTAAMVEHYGVAEVAE